VGATPIPAPRYQRLADTSIISKMTLTCTAHRPAHRSASDSSIFHDCSECPGQGQEAHNPPLNLGVAFGKGIGLSTSCVLNLSSDLSMKWSPLPDYFDSDQSSMSWPAAAHAHTQAGRLPGREVGGRSSWVFFFSSLVLGRGGGGGALSCGVSSNGPPGRDSQAVPRPPTPTHTCIHTALSTHLLHRWRAHKQGARSKECTGHWPRAL
jgi:hypothetical protein